MTPDFTALRARYSDKPEITVPIGTLSEQIRNIRNPSCELQRQNLLIGMDYTSKKLKQALAAVRNPQETWEQS